jgi:hypothetical protein
MLLEKLLLHLMLPVFVVFLITILLFRMMLKLTQGNEMGHGKENNLQHTNWSARMKHKQTDGVMRGYYYLCISRNSQIRIIFISIETNTILSAV